MVYQIDIYLLDSPLIVAMLISIAGILVVKITYKLIELIPGM